MRWPKSAQPALRRRSLVKTAAAIVAGLVGAACAAGGPVALPGALSSPPVAAGPEAMAAAFAWSPAVILDWSDFRGRPDVTSEAAAMTAYSIKSEVRCDAGAFSFRVESYFLPTHSWVKPAHLAERSSDRTLQHERTHFDLSEVQARRARQGLAAIVSPCALSDDELDRLIAPHLKSDAGTQAEYDRETAHGTNTSRQAEWDARVRRWLLELPR